MKKVGLLLIVFLLCLLRNGSAEDLSWNTYIFPNGFTLITKEVHDHPACSAHLFIGAGSVDEEPRINGISHFYEHLFFKGTKRRTATDMKSEIESYGGDINGATYRDYTEFIVNIPAPYADKGVDLLLDAFLNVTFDPVELEKERKVVLDEVSIDEENPQHRLSDLFQKTIYTVHPYRLPVAGNSVSVRSITRDDVLNWKKRFYIPSNATLVVVGDINSEKIKEQVGSVVKDVPAQSFVPPAYSPEPTKSAPIVREYKEQIEDSFYVLGYLVGGLNSPEDIYPLDVITFMLGYGRSSLLTRELKDRLHLVDSISADFLTERYPGTLEVEVFCKPEEVDESKKKIVEIFDKIRKGEVEQSEIDRAKTLLEGTYTLGNETDSEKVSTLGFYAAMGSANFPKNYLSRIKQVSLADIIRVAQKYFGNNYAQVVFFPRENQPGPKKP